MSEFLRERQLLLWVGAFALCVGPTVISYQPYTCRWDDADYLTRSINASRAFWAGDIHGLGTAMRSIRPPVMTLLGLPWGPISSWGSAGKCFLTLNGLTSFFVALSLYLMLCAGLKPHLLVVASLCLFAALGPYPTTSEAHTYATGFMADSLFAWNVLAAVLLIPYESTFHDLSDRGALLRGLQWATVLLVGCITKVSFFYFLVLVVPILLAVRTRTAGIRSALVALASLSLCSVPVAIYWLFYGLPSLRNGWAASFGRDAPYYYVPFVGFLRNMIRDVPGLAMSGAFVVICVLYLFVKPLAMKRKVDLLPVLILASYGIVGLASKNRELRLLFPLIIAPPFLLGLLVSGRTCLASRRQAVGAALLVFLSLTVAGLAMEHRMNRQCINRADAVLAEARRSDATRVLLATDGPTLNLQLVLLSEAVAPPRPPLEVDSLAYRAVSGVPIDEDLRSIRNSDLVVFQNKEALAPPFTNQRVGEYYAYARQIAVGEPVEVGGDVILFPMHARPSRSSVTGPGAVPKGW